MISQTRRQFLTTAAAASVANALGTPRAPAAEPPLETTTVRLQAPGLCVAPVYISEELLRAEGFTDIRYDDTSEIGAIAPVARGRVDFAPIYASQSVRAIDAGEPVKLLAGVMIGCFELFAREGIGSIAELKDKSIGVQTAGSLSQQLVTLMVAQVGLDPVQDVHWITDSSVNPIELFVQRKIDAFLGFPPAPQELRARRIGHVIVNTGVDRPWSQYFCCMIASNPDYVRSRPSACCAPSSRRRTFASPIRRGLRDSLSMAALRQATTMPYKRLATTLTSGRNMAPKTRLGGTPCVFTKWA